MGLLIAISASSLIPAIFHSTTAGFINIIGKYGYYALFGIMLLESMSLPIPSEVVLPVTGFLAARGQLSFVLALATSMAAGLLGMAIDYYIAYFLGKDVIYNHLEIFHIEKGSLENFDKWFEKNGPFAVFICRLLPVVRGFVNFPAGFALMNKKKFFLYSFVGIFIWAVILMAFGYYAIDIKNPYMLVVYIGIFVAVLTVLYIFAKRLTRKRGN